VTNRFKLGSAAYGAENGVNDLFDEYLEDPADFQEISELAQDAASNQENLASPMQVVSETGSNRLVIGHGVKRVRDTAQSDIDRAPQ
jgi:hypothetical protein